MFYMKAVNSIFISVKFPSTFMALIVSTIENSIIQLQETSPLQQVLLRLGPLRSLVKMIKVTVFTPISTGIMNKKNVLLGFKQQNGLQMEHWVGHCWKTKRRQPFPSGDVY